MPVSSYFKGKGKEVMSSMMDEYGAEKGKKVFYATANKHLSMKGKKKHRPIFGNRKGKE